jgi:hypothetical protein
MKRSRFTEEHIIAMIISIIASPMQAILRDFIAGYFLFSEL